MFKKYLKLIRDSFIDKYFTKIYSQDGEDLLALRYFANKEKGFFIDIGAHHPKRFSNTYLLYQKGWSGINLDAMPGSMTAFKICRPRDINIEVAIGNEKTIRDFYIFSEPALNTFDKTLAEEREKTQKLTMVNKIQVAPLADILKEHCPNNTKIDFLTIDIEGLDFEILKTNDWNKYRPQLLCVEIYSKNIQNVLESEINIFLEKIGYQIIYRVNNSCFFELKT
jgi:FkbM family methyltransferase